MMSTYGFAWFIWALNLLFDNKGGFMHWMFYWFSKVIYLFVPAGNLALAYIANAAYGSASQVENSSKVGGDHMYIIIKETDVTYGYAFGWTFIFCITDFVMVLISWTPISNYYAFVNKKSSN